MLDQISMSRLKALNASWRRHPPLRVLAAAFVNHKPEEKPRAPAASNLGPDFFAVAKKLKGK